MVPDSEERAYVLSLIDWSDGAVQTILDNFDAIRPALFCGILLGVANEVLWKLAALRTLRRFAQLPPQARVAVCERFDFYWGFYFISFATFNAAASFLVVSAFCVLIFFSFFAPFLRTELWWTLFVSTGVGSMAIR